MLTLLLSCLAALGCLALAKATAMAAGVALHVPVSKRVHALCTRPRRQSWRRMKGSPQVQGGRKGSWAIEIGKNKHSFYVMLPVICQLLCQPDCLHVSLSICPTPCLSGNPPLPTQVPTVRLDVLWAALADPHFGVPSLLTRTAILAASLFASPAPPATAPAAAVADAAAAASTATSTATTSSSFSALPTLPTLFSLKTLSALPNDLPDGLFDGLFAAAACAAACAVLGRLLASRLLPPGLLLGWARAWQGLRSGLVRASTARQG